MKAPENLPNLPFNLPEISKIENIERVVDKNSGIEASSPVFSKSGMSGEASFKLDGDVNFEKERIRSGGIIRFNSNPPEKPDFSSNLISSGNDASCPI